MSEQSSDGTSPGTGPNAPGPGAGGPAAPQGPAPGATAPTWDRLKPAGRAPGPAQQPAGWYPGAELPGFDEAAAGVPPAAPGPRIDPYGDRSSAATSAPVAPPPQEPCAPSGAPTAPSNAIGQYAVHRNRTYLIAVAALVLVILMAMMAVAMRSPRQDQGEQGAAPSTSAAPSTPGQSTSVVGAIPVESGSFTGTWQISSSRWDSNGLVIDMTITSTKGRLAFTTFAIDNASTGQTNGTGEMASGTVEDGRTTQGEVRFGKDRNDTTIVLADASGHQITALVVPA
ncbi:hypothetical protein [Propionibacterium acidifaciens]